MAHASRLGQKYFEYYIFLDLQVFSLGNYQIYIMDNVSTFNRFFYHPSHKMFTLQPLTHIYMIVVGTLSLLPLDKELSAGHFDNAT